MLQFYYTNTILFHFYLIFHALRIRIRITEFYEVEVEKNYLYFCYQNPFWKISFWKKFKQSRRKKNAPTESSIGTCNTNGIDNQMQLLTLQLKTALHLLIAYKYVVQSHLFFFSIPENIKTNDNNGMNERERKKVSFIRYEDETQMVSIAKHIKCQSIESHNEHNNHVNV